MVRGTSWKQGCLGRAPVGSWGHATGSPTAERQSPVLRWMAFTSSTLLCQPGAVRGEGELQGRLQLAPLPDTWHLLIGGRVCRGGLGKGSLGALGRGQEGLAPGFQ